MAMLRQGLAGEPVRRLQNKLGIKADGQFGPATEAALKSWQREHGLSPDGVAGPDTFVEMGLWELVLLKPGTQGAAVKRLQEKLGLAADGKFGSQTEKAVRDYQQKNGLTADGIAGPVTLARMTVFKEITPKVVEQSQVPASAAAATPGTQPTQPMQAAAMPGGATVQADKPKSIWDTIVGAFK